MSPRAPPLLSASVFTKLCLTHMHTRLPAWLSVLSFYVRVTCASPWHWPRFIQPKSGQVARTWSPHQENPYRLIPGPSSSSLLGNLAPAASGPLHVFLSTSATLPLSTVRLPPSPGSGLSMDDTCHQRPSPSWATREQERGGSCVGSGTARGPAGVPGSLPGRAVHLCSQPG